ncbi:MULTISPECIES: hypothetical protein [Phaeobacter]|uniref:hypothetical protein n=1 Tax=Phaeobacter TaxID=302485 RepID=UPI001F5AA26D|nr:MULTISPECIES: hypothetical protein [Phaeobacter]
MVDMLGEGFTRGMVVGLQTGDVDANTRRRHVEEILLTRKIRRHQYEPKLRPVVAPGIQNRSPTPGFDLIAR